jgi:hypothetical protein
MLTNHVCRVESPTGPWIIEDTDKRICGKAMCILCREKNKTNEPEYDNICFYHNPSCTQFCYENEKQSEMRKENDMVDSNDSILVDNESLSTFIPDYIEVQCCIEAMEYVFDSFSNESYTGYRLLNHRVNKQKIDSSVTTEEMRKKRNEKRKQWKSLLNDAMTRTIIRKKRKASSLDDTNIAVSLFGTSSNDSHSLSSQINKRKRLHRRAPLLPLQSQATNDLNRQMFKQKKDSQRKFSFRCSFKGCNNNNLTQNKSFSRVPSPQNKPLPDIDSSGHRELKTYFKKKLHHSLFLKAMGLKENDWNDSGLRICSDHEIKKNVKHSKKIMRKGKQHKYDFTFDLPNEVGIGHKKNVTASRKDTAYERRMIRQWDMRKEELKKKPEHGEEAVGRIVELEQLVQMLAESPSSKFTNATVNNRFGISQSPDLRENKQTRKFRSQINEKNENKEDKSEINTPTIKPMSMSDVITKNRTGFASEGEMLAFICVVCNGNIEKIKATQSSTLTWYEEWLLYFEVVWGRTFTSLDKLFLERFGLGCKMTMNKIIDTKAKLVLECRKSWPTYVSMSEDEKLRKKKWNEKYKNKRIVMWDDTNIPFTYKPSSALNQRITYSAYYGMNCAKGGVFLQLCGWLGVEELWVGAVSDSMYMDQTSILKDQHNFAQNDLINNKYIPFSNILDKGYRITRICWREGEQECIQPCFASSDRKFTSSEMLVSATVAADRSGNERAVKICKGSAYLKRGLKPSGCPKRLNNVWMAWSFQANFMYDSVL